MKPAQIEERQYFYLKYLHLVNKIRVLVNDANCIAKHIENLESGNLNEIDLYNLYAEDKKECQS